MSYSMFVAGQMFVAQGLSHALARPVRPSRRKGLIGLLVGRGEDYPSLAECLERLPKLLISNAGSYLEIEQDETSGILTAHGILVEDDFLDHGATLVECFCVLAEAGGEGGCYFLEEQVVDHSQDPELCYVVHASGGKARIEHVPEAEQTGVIHTGIFDPVLGRLEEELERAQTRGTTPSPWAKHAPKKPTTKKPASKRPASKRPASKKPATKRPVAKRPALKKQPATKPTSKKKPALKKPRR
jgi:hypothetical protein